MAGTIIDPHKAVATTAPDQFTIYNRYDDLMEGRHRRFPTVHGLKLILSI
jgi:hypothetical protein